MALFAIGDIQGCRQPLENLLKKISFTPSQDHLVLVGDLINRGPDSRGVLELVMSLGEAVSCVLGNHDLNTLAVAEGLRTEKPRDTVSSLIRSRRSDELLGWLRHQPLMLERDGYLFAHAGIYPEWSTEEALGHAREVETALRGPDYREFLGNMFGAEPARWNPALEGWPRLRFITNSFTRMRYVDESGTLDFEETGPPGTQRAGLTPWFEHEKSKRLSGFVVFGHWSSLGYHVGGRSIALDSGCVWGRSLTAIRLEVDSITPYRVRC